MIVKCTTKFAKDLPKDLQLKEFKPEYVFKLDVGSSYVVYAMIYIEEYLWYYLIADNRIDYPMAYPSPLFSIDNPKLSKYWEYYYSSGENSAQQSIRFSFPEWVYEPSFYFNLVDGEEREIKIFRDYQGKMDLEFPDPRITTTGKIIEDGWVMCPNCSDAWQPKTTDGMIICPSCKTLMRNPEYQKL